MPQSTFFLYLGCWLYVTKLCRELCWRTHAFFPQQPQHLKQPLTYFSPLRMRITGKEKGRALLSCFRGRHFSFNAIKITQNQMCTNWNISHELFQETCTKAPYFVRMNIKQDLWVPPRGKPDYYDDHHPSYGSPPPALCSTVMETCAP